MTADRCPGVLRPHPAADGAMVRVPGGQTSAAALRALGRAAERCGSGLLQLTSRAGVQVRGLPEPPSEAFADALADAGFLPSTTHERVRNVLASPLTGLAGGRADLRSLVRELDAALQARPGLAALSGRFLFGLDDGRGDVEALSPDVGYRALTADEGLLRVADRGRRVRRTEAVAALLEVAEAFAAAAGVDTWRVADRPGFADGLAGLEPLVTRFTPRPPAAGAGAPAPGVLGRHLVVGVPLGLLTPAQTATLTAVDGPLVLTPWRSVVVVDGAARRPTLAASGLVTEPTSAWTALSGCVGAPWCTSGRADVQTLLRDAVAARPDAASWPRAHVTGCERRCGAPAEPHLDLVTPTAAELLAVSRPQRVAHA